MLASTDDLFTTTTIVSLLGVVAILATAYGASVYLLPKSARSVDRYIFVWLGFDALIHFIFEGSFLYHSTFGRAVFRESGPFAELCKMDNKDIVTVFYILLIFFFLVFLREGVCKG